jgi:hypothetical protein
MHRDLKIWEKIYQKRREEKFSPRKVQSNSSLTEEYKCASPNEKEYKT